MAGAETVVTRLLAACALALAGCAGLSVEQCRSSDWYRVGERDGLFGLQPQIELYAVQCAAHGVAPQASAYAEGWRAGYAEFTVRTSGSGVD